MTTLPGRSQMTLVNSLPCTPIKTDAASTAATWSAGETSAKFSTQSGSLEAMTAMSSATVPVTESTSARTLRTTKSACGE